MSTMSIQRTASGRPVPEGANNSGSGGHPRSRQSQGNQPPPPPSLDEQIAAGVGAVSEAFDAFDYEHYAAIVAESTDNYVATMRELTELQINEGKKFAIIQMVQSKIGQAAMDDFRVAQDFVLRNLETGYIEQETMMGVTSAAIPMPFISGHAVAQNAPSVKDRDSTLYGDDFSPDPLDRYEAHMNRMDEIVAVVQSGEELSDADKTYLEGLRPSIDWRDVDAIYNEARKAREAFDAFNNMRTERPDPEHFAEWLEESGNTHIELSGDMIDAHQNWLAVKEQHDQLLSNPPVGGTQAEVEDWQAQVRTHEAEMEEAEAAYQDALDEMFDSALNSEYPGPPSAGSQSVPGMAASSVNLNEPDGDEDFDAAEAVLGELA